MVRDAETERFLVELARDLHERGSSSPRVEMAVSGAARALGVRVQILASPTSLQLAFGSDDDQRTHLLRSNTGAIDLCKLVELDRVIDRVLAGQWSSRRAREELEFVRSLPAPHAAVTEWLAFGVVGAAAVALLGGGLREAGVALVTGLVIGGLTRWSGANPLRAPLLDLTSAAWASFAAAACSATLFGVREGVVTMAALIVLIPGLSFTAAMSELAHRHLISGTSRLAGSMITFLQLGLGIALGLWAGEACFGSLRRSELGPVFHAWSVWIAVPVAAAAFVVLFRARWRALPVVTAIGGLGFGVSALIGAAANPVLGSFAGAFAVCGASNFYARIARRPASLTLLPGIILLVPGTVGMRSLSAFLQSDLAGGAGAAFAMILSGVALVGGMLMAHLLIVPRRFL